MEKQQFEEMYTIKIINLPSRVRVMVFNATFNNISVISSRRYESFYWVCIRLLFKQL